MACNGRPTSPLLPVKLGPLTHDPKQTTDGVETFANVSVEKYSSAPEMSVCSSFLNTSQQLFIFHLKLEGPPLKRWLIYHFNKAVLHSSCRWVCNL
jgi:hypothetical protein